MFGGLDLAVGQLKTVGSLQTKLRFSGDDYDYVLDNDRLSSQILRIFHLMKDSKWRTLGEIEKITGDPQASISAQLRHLRKERFGKHTVERRRVTGMEKRGLYDYRLIVNDDGGYFFES